MYYFVYSNLTFFFSYVDFLPGAELTFLFNTPKVLGELQHIVLWWEAKYNSLNPIDWLRKHYLFVEGNIELTSPAGSLSRLRPANPKIEEEKPVTAYVVAAQNLQ